ncbi:hypothetical protein BLNAU_20419 [Blattamonas nauphoetae]|uniref:Uncharacterized protein n=1 Tax=Blattamonas nauphoetae TaxID=2049346 RepID=A0ABQ9WZG0_9EUKA|nr:hypothetical protein BLNAU_20419 [Blattamonas nauphoetae]
MLSRPQRAICTKSLMSKVTRHTPCGNFNSRRPQPCHPNRRHPHPGAAAGPTSSSLPFPVLVEGWAKRGDSAPMTSPPHYHRHLHFPHKNQFLAPHILQLLQALSVYIHFTITKIVQKMSSQIGALKVRLELTKCGAGGENGSEDYFHDNEEREESQRQVVKERLKNEKSAQKLSETLSSLQTEHSRLLNSHNTVFLSHLPSQPNAVTNDGLLHDFAKLWTTTAVQTA